MPGSRSIVLRRVRNLPTPAYPPPHIVGIDDWAWRKGHRYGTIVVDLERGCPIDVLADRLADTVADWLKAHPEVQVVARDRAGSYASGIRQGGACTRALVPFRVTQSSFYIYGDYSIHTGFWYDSRGAFVV
jgi:transposase